VAGITTTSTLPAPVQQTFSYKLLSVPVPNMIHKIPAMKKEMPRNGGTTLRMRRLSLADIKSLVIDLEARWGNKAQASAA
jgi:hypothetical protein